MNPPLIVILGETASGKSALALELAEKFNGELICADSRTVYKGMDIGTAKPSAEERARVKHYGLDVVYPGEHFSAADFQQLANEAIRDISNRGKVPIIVGGTGLYIDSVLFDFKFRKVAEPELRAHLENLSVEELQQEIAAKGLPLPENGRNPRHLVRILETEGEPSTKQPLRPNTLVLGLKLSRDVLEQRITQRVEQMVEHGFIDEVKKLYEQYGAETEALRAPGYKAFSEYILGHINLEEAKALFIKNDLNLAKRQRSWFKRNEGIQWLDDPRQAVDVVTSFLNK